MDEWSEQRRLQKQFFQFDSSKHDSIEVEIETF